MTALMFTAFRMHQRKLESSHLFSAGKLFQEYICESFAIIEQQRLRYLQFNQKKLRADLYSGLQVFSTVYW